MDIDFITNSCHCCMSQYEIKFEIPQFYIEDDIQPFLVGNNMLVMNYMEFINLNERTLKHIVRVADLEEKSSNEMYYHLPIILFMIEQEYGRPMRNKFYKKLITGGIDPYYKITQEHLDTLINNGFLIIYLYTINEITMNNKIDIDLNRIQIEYLLDCMKQIKDLDKKEWKKVLSKFIIKTIENKITLEDQRVIEIRDTKMFQVLQKALLSSICKNVVYKNQKCTTIEACNTKKRII